MHDIVAFARSQDILCQGRGSAANSAVCYCLGITAVDPSLMETLFARFISLERNEPPDIDVDFEHERREEVIQYIWAVHSRDRAVSVDRNRHFLPPPAIGIARRGQSIGARSSRRDWLAKSMAWWSLWPGDGAAGEGTPASTPNRR